MKIVIPGPTTRLIRALPATIVILVLFAGVGCPLISIQLRLWRNGAIAAQLVESLRVRFPGAEFRGIASYEREVIYIQVLGGLRMESRSEVEQLLRGFKSEQRIAPEIWLEFPEFSGEEKDAIKI
jgi:hypothetical protein